MEFKRTKPAPNFTVFRPVKTTSPKPIVNHRTDPFVEYWNSLLGLRKHRLGTAIYSSSAKAIRELLAGLSKRPWDPYWIKRNRINVRFLHDPWSEAAVYRAMDNLSQMTQIGYWPGPGSVLCKTNLSDAVYNPNKQVSWMMLARSRMNAPVSKERQEEFIKEKLSPASQELLNQCSIFSVVLPFPALPQIVKQYNNDLKARYGPLLEHLCPGIDSFGRMLGAWLAAQGFDHPNGGIYPPNGWIWKKFISATFPREDGDE